MQCEAKKEEKGGAKGQLHFGDIPDYARFLLHEKLEDVIRESLFQAREMEYPLLKYFDHMPEEQLLALSRISQTEFLTYVINNNLNQQIEQSLDRWRENQLPLVDKDQIVGEDITMGSFLRKKVWMKFLPAYTSDTSLALSILTELDEYHMRHDAAAFKTFINIQNEKLSIANKSLQEKEDLYKQAQALTHIGNWSWSIFDNKIDWSDEMYRIYGLRPQSEEITFERFASMIHPEDRENRISQVYKSLETLAPPHYIMRIIRPDGSIAVLSGKNEVLIDNTGKPYKMVGTCQDITIEYQLQESIKEINRSLQTKNMELERSNKELASFNYVASHDLQEPLRKIKTYSDLITQSDEVHLSEKSRKYLNNINSAAGRMTQLIQDLLSYSRAHNYAAEINAVNLNDTLKEIRDQYEDKMAEVNLTLNVGELPVIKGASFQFYQLFENLLSNSIKYRKSTADPIVKIYASTISGEKIEVAGADRNRDYHLITVSDNGIGFAPEFNSKIFEIFQRLHNADEYSGTGIGLAICRRIVQNYNGFILASGTPDEGATFSIYLPA